MSTINQKTTIKIINKMKKDEKHEKIISNLRKDWSEWRDKPAKEIENALKKVVELKVPLDEKEIDFYYVSVQRYETEFKKSNPPRDYKKLTPSQKIDLENDYKKKLEEIEIFMRSFYCVILKQRFGENVPQNIINQIKYNLENKKYFSGTPINFDLRNNISTWIRPLYNYWLEEKRNTMEIGFELLKDEVEDEILKYKNVDKWAYHFRGELFIELSNWVSEFIENLEKVMLAESERNVNFLKGQINPKFYLIKTTEKGSAVVFSESGDLYVFPKGKAPIPYTTREINKSEFKNCIKKHPTAFPEFFPEEW